MGARLLAYGGTSFSERRRIGTWPAIPEAMLRDTYGLQANVWSYGLGVLEKQPFLIFRQRQNVESRGGYPFSLLLDPGDPLWERFEWNAAALIVGLLNASPVQLFQTPESCSADTLDRLLDATQPLSLAPTNESYAELLASSLYQAVIVPARPEPGQFAAALSQVPVCFRAGGGFLIGGAPAHSRALGANLVFDPQSRETSAAGPDILAAWNAYRKQPFLQAREAKPAWQWDEPPKDFLDSLLTLRSIETANTISDELIERAHEAPFLRTEIEQATVTAVLKGSAPLGPKASQLLIGFALSGKRKLNASMAERLHTETLAAELRRIGSPPKRPPKSLPVPHDLRLRLWVDYLERLQSDVHKNLADALEQFGPEDRGPLVEAALAALPASDEKLTHWARFREDPALWALIADPLRDEVLRRVRRKDKYAKEAYALFFLEPDAVAPAEPEESPGLRAALHTLLFESDREAVDDRSGDLRARFDSVNTPDLRATLDDLVESGCATNGQKFAGAFAGKYLALGDAMRFLSTAAQDRLMECFASHHPDFISRAGDDLKHALNHSNSRNAYSRALSRLVLKDRRLCREVASYLVELPLDLETKLRRRLLAKDGQN